MVSALTSFCIESKVCLLAIAFLCASLGALYYSYHQRGHVVLVQSRDVSATPSSAQREFQDTHRADGLEPFTKSSASNHTYANQTLLGSNTSREPHDASLHSYSPSSDVTTIAVTLTTSSKPLTAVVQSLLPASCAECPFGLCATCDFMSRSSTTVADSAPIVPTTTANHVTSTKMQMLTSTSTKHVLASTTAWTAAAIKKEKKHRRRRSYSYSNYVSDHIENIFVLNLDSRLDKWRFMQNVLNSTRVKYERWPAIRPLPTFEHLGADFATLAGQPNGFIARRINASSQRYRNILGCYLSHVSVLQHIYQIGHQRMLFMVMEDDHSLTVDLSAAVPKILSMVPPSWDAIRLDCWGDVNGTSWKPHGAILDPNAKVFRTTDCWHAIQKRSVCFGGTHAVLYHYDSVPRILEYLRHEPWADIDSMFWTDRLNNYCVNLNITAWNVAAQSDIPKTFD